MNQTQEHLRLLAIFHYVVGGIGFLISLFPSLHLAMGLMMLFMPVSEPPEITASIAGAEPIPVPKVENGSSSSEIRVEAEDTTVSGNLIASEDLPPADEFPARVMGGIFVGFSALFILAGFILSTLIIIAGRRLVAYRSHTFCLVMAGIECILMPFGTVLGIFTIIVLLKPEARELFGLPALTENKATQA